MIPVTFNTQPAYLLDDAPDWAYRFSVEASIPGIYERGLTGRETRRPTADTLRLSCSFTAILTSNPAIARLRNALQGLNVQPVLCPFYPGLFDAGAAPLVTAAHYALFNADGSYNSIQPASALPFALRAAPLMVGILSENPEPKMLSFTTALVEFKFSENGNYPLSFPEFEVGDGLDTAGGVRPLFPFLPDWSTRPHTGGSEQDVDRRQIGNLRTLATAYYAQRGRRTCKQFFTFQNNDAFNLLRFFHDMGGEQNNFWLAAAMSEAQLAVNLEAADTAMTVDNGAALGTNSFILLGDGINRVPAVVDSVVANVWNLHSAPGTAFKVGLTAIESLVLARFDTLKLELDFANPNVATATLQFKELPWETNAVGGETYGTTMGALPPTSAFFKFTITPTAEAGGAAIVWRFTNYERDLSDGVNTWLSAPMEFDSVTSTYDLKRQEVAITSRHFAGNPLSLLFPQALEFPLAVEIYEADINPATDIATGFQKYFSGEINNGDFEPPFITAKCATLSQIFDRQIPRRLYQRTDNWCLFEPANGLASADWKWTAVVVSYDEDSATMVVDTIATSVAHTGIELEENYFSFGHVIITTDGKKQIRMVSTSSVVVAGELTLKLSDFVNVAPAAGDVVDMYPGYDGQAATAADKFGNYQTRFGGFPFIPMGNPTVLRITSAGGGGKK
ncbi:MAG: phage BR0599 family protein [Verrucomicrobiota bacterium]